MSKGYKLATDGTENHLVLWDLRPQGLTGSKLEKICDAVSITLNRNAVNGDSSALSPGGVRIGLPAMTTRGCKAAMKIQESHGKKLKDFETGIPGNADLAALK